MCCTFRVCGWPCQFYHALSILWHSLCWWNVSSLGRKHDPGNLAVCVPHGVWLYLHVKPRIVIAYAYNRAFIAVTFASSRLGRAVALASEAKKAVKAAEMIFEILHRRPQVGADEGDFPLHQMSGEIVFRNLHFRYPTRKGASVLKVSNHAWELFVNGV